MFGPHWEDNFGYQNTMGAMGYGNFLTDSTKFGIIPKSIEEIFNELSMKEAELGFTVYCSFLQIYNEKLYDLLQDTYTKNPL